MNSANRCIIYVDGFNLYHGALKGTVHKWLDLQHLFELVRPVDEIIAIRYFTALIAGPTASQQRRYLEALATRPLVQVRLGRFKMKEVKCGVRACTHDQSRLFQRPEEKHTDVNIALAMLDDAYQNSCDKMVLVSGDSDLVPAVHMVRDRFPRLHVTVYVPARNHVRGAAVELRNAANASRILPNDLIRKAQLPPQVSDASGRIIEKPAAWSTAY